MSERTARPKASDLLKRAATVEPNSTDVQEHRSTEIQTEPVRQASGSSATGRPGMARLTLDLPATKVHELKLRALALDVTAAAIVQALVEAYLQGAIDVDPEPIHRARRGRGRVGE